MPNSKAVVPPLKDRESITRYGVLASSRLNCCPKALHVELFWCFSFIFTAVGLTQAQPAAKHPPAAHAKRAVDSFSRVFLAVGVQGTRSQSVCEAF
jgi:hypothetical protein